MLLKLLLVLEVLLEMAENYYIDKYDGSASGDGSFSSPWRKFSDISSLEPNDRVKLKRGDVYRDILTVGDSGNEWADIVFEAWGDSADDKPIIDGADVVAGFIPYGTEKLVNGSLEDWDSGSGEPDGWTKTENGTSTITEETTEIKHLTSAAKFAHDGSGSILRLQNTTPISLVNNTSYRLSLQHFNPDSDMSDYGLLGLQIYRTGGTPPDDYLQTTGGPLYSTWDGAVVYFPLVPDSVNYVSPYWEEFSIDFNTGSNSDGHTDYYVVIITFPAVGAIDPSNKTFYIDNLSLGKRTISVVGNNISNESFENWTGSVPDDFSLLREGSSELEESDNKQFGDKSVRFIIDENSSDVGLTQNISLISNTTYRMSVFHMDREYGVDSLDAEIALKLKDDTTGLYWDDIHSAWSSEAVDINIPHEPEWEVCGIEFTTPVSGSSTYTVTIHRSDEAAQSPGLSQYQDLFVDFLVVIKKDQANEVFSINIKGPEHVYVTGTFGGETYLDSAAQTPGASSQPHPLHLHYQEDTTYPYLYCWSYDSTDEILYINLGANTSDLTIYVSVRANNIDMNGESYITMRDIAGTRSYESSVVTGYGNYPGGNSPTNLTLERIRTDHSGWLGIQIGYRPDDPVPSGAPGSDNHYTPKEVLIDDCDVYMFNRCKIIKLLKSGSEWYNGYGVPNAGIRFFKGKNPSSASGNLTVRRCNVIGDFPLINMSTGRNGISFLTGANVLCEENYITMIDHAIAVVGAFEGGTGAAAAAIVRRNQIENTGDDGIWFNGILTPNNKICYNTVKNVQDNCVDLMDVELVEVYGNTFHDNENEMISLWGNDGTITRAWIYNNIFSRWGDHFRTNVATPGKRLGTAIGFGGAGVDREGSKIDYNIYYQDSSVDTYGYPAHYLSGGEYYQMTFEDLQALGYEEHGMVADPKLYDPDNGDLYIMRDSPAFQAGRNLSECNDYLTSIYPVVHTEGPIVYFDKDDVDENLLVATSSWPDGVLTTPQGSYWHIGAFAMETPTITKASGDPEFLTDGSLIGVPVYLVDTTDNYIWKGIIISNTADVLTLDDWEPLFNAEGKQPYGSDYTYYVGYIYLYDKTGRISMFNEYWIKNLKRYELLTNNVEENETVYFRFSADHEKTVHDDSSSLSMERPNVLVHDVKGMNKNFVLEHAMITKQSIRVKGSVYYGAWMRGTMVQ